MIGEVLLFLVSLAVTLAAAAFFARRLDRVGLRLGLPETLLGLLTALAADAPEVSSAIAALVKGEHAVGAGVVLALGFFVLFRTSHVALLFRASASDPYAAELMGVNVTRLDVVTWTVAGGLAGAAAVLVAPLVGFDIFFMTLLAIPFGMTTGKRGTLYGIGIGIVLALSYWIVMGAFGAIGKAGVLTPVMAGWAPNILAAGSAAYLLLTART